MQFDLVFEGGGAKGMVFVGALEVFESAGHTHDRLLGTSAGAITAAFLAAGYRTSEMLEALVEKSEGRSVFAGFMGTPTKIDSAELRASATRDLLRRIDLPFLPEVLEEQLDDRLAAWLTAQPSLRHVFSFIERGGWYAADGFLEWLRRRLDTGVDAAGQPRRYSALTLAEFFAQTRRDLTLVAADTTAAEMLVLNHRTAPDLPLVWAVRMSMSVPLLWQEVIWQPEWGRYAVRPGREREMAGHAIVDGGLLSNFPIELFVSRDATVTKVMGPSVSQRVLGLLIDETMPVPGAEAAPPPTDGLAIGQFRTVQRLAGLMNTALSARDKMVVDALEKHVVRLPAKGYGTTEFDMTDDRRDKLVEAGREAMRQHLARVTPDELVSFDPQAAGEDAAAQDWADRQAVKRLLP